VRWVVKEDEVRRLAKAADGEVDVVMAARYCDVVEGVVATGEMRVRQRLTAKTVVKVKWLGLEAGLLWKVR